MTNVTKVTRPFYEKFLNRSSVGSNILSGTLFNVMPVQGQVKTLSSDKTKINFLLKGRTSF